MENLNRGMSRVTGVLKLQLGLRSNSPQILRQEIFHPKESHQHCEKNSSVTCERYSNPWSYYPKFQDIKQALISNDTQTQTMLVVIWTEKASQIPVKYLVENWFVGVLRNSSQWLCHQRRLNMLMLLGVVQNYLREFWSIVVAYDPFPSTDETEQCPLREFLIKFSVLNGQRPLTLDFNTFCSSTGLDYNNGKYVAHPTPEIVLGGNYSSTEQVNSIQHLLAYCLITGTEVDIGEIIYSDLVTKILNKSRLKYVSYPRFISCALQVLLGCDYTQDAKFGYLLGILSNFNFTKDPSKVSNIELTAHMIVVNNQRDSESPLPFSAKKKKVKSQTMTPTIPKSYGPEASESLPQKRKKPQLSGKKQPIDTGLPSTDSNEGTAKTTPRLEGPLGDKDSGGNKTPADMEPINPTIVDPLGTGDKYQESEEDILGAGEEVDEDSQTAAVQH
ncbi:hypothetical protein Tco_0722837 [Tanacetum coccineum]